MLFGGMLNGGSRHAVEFLDDAEDEERGHQADAHQCAPHDVEVLAPQDGGDAHEEVAHGGGHKPSAHHHALELRGSHLGDKGDADGGEQKFGKGEDEIGAHQDVGAHVGQVLGCLGVGGGQADGGDGHQQVGDGRHQHSQSNLHGCLGFLALLAKPAEERDAHGSESHYKTGVELLEDGCRHFHLTRLCVFPAQDDGGYQDYCAPDALLLHGLALADAKQAIDNHDADQEVGHVKLHGGHACGCRGHIVAREVCERGSVLVESHPEEYDHGIHEHQAHDALDGLVLAEFPLACRLTLEGVLLLHVGHLLEGGLETIVDGDGYYQ